jgi:hypothetical protein
VELRASQNDWETTKKRRGGDLLRQVDLDYQLVAVDPHRHVLHRAIPSIFSIHAVSPPACCITRLASAYASWHRVQAASNPTGWNTIIRSFVLTLAMVSARSSSTSDMRRRARCGPALGIVTTWPGLTFDAATMRVIISARPAMVARGDAGESEHVWQLSILVGSPGANARPGDARRGQGREGAGRGAYADAAVREAV